MALRITWSTFLVALLIASHTDATEYTFETLQFPGSVDTVANGITNDDVVVGTYYVDGSDEAHGFVWEDGEFETPELDLELANVSFDGISNHYDIVGSAIAPFAIPGFVFFNNEVFPFEFPGALATFANGVNDELDIVGSFRNSLEDDRFRAFYEFEDGILELTIPDFIDVFALGINNQRQVVGGAYDANDDESGFIFENGEVTLFNHPDGATELVDINNLGILAGTVVDDSGLRSFVFDGEEFHDVMFPGASETSVWGMNDLGVLVGEYMPDGSDDYAGFIAWPVPEPSGLLLMFFTLLPTASMRRSRSPDLNAF